jgi:serine/threonine protein kinase
MSAVNPLPPFPLEGRDLAQVTRTEVAEAVKIAPEIRSCLGGPSIARVTSSAIVKYGRHIHLHEARNMQYVSENTNIRLPAVVDAWEAEDKTLYDESNTCYIVMEYIEGRLVSDIWDDLDDKGRRSIIRQLYEYTRELQALKMDRPGPVGGGISEGSFFTDYGAGPFKSRKDIEDWFNDRLLVCHDFGHASQTPPGCFAGRFDELVMCYLDIHPRNLILDGQGKLWLLDWAFSGAYPPYFETANLIWRGPGDFAAGLVELIGSKIYLAEIRQLLAISFALTTGAYCQSRVRANETSKFSGMFPLPEIYIFSQVGNYRQLYLKESSSL